MHARLSGSLLFLLALAFCTLTMGRTLAQGPGGPLPVDPVPGEEEPSQDVETKMWFTGQGINNVPGGVGSTGKLTINRSLNSKHTHISTTITVHKRIKAQDGGEPGEWQLHVYSTTKEGQPLTPGRTTDQQIEFLVGSNSEYVVSGWITYKDDKGKRRDLDLVKSELYKP